MESASRDRASGPDEASEFDEPELRLAVDDPLDGTSGIGSTGRAFGCVLLAVFLAGMVFAILYVVS